MGLLGNGEGRGREEKKAPAGADTAAAVGKYRERSCGSRQCCGSGEIQIALLREQILLRQWGNTDSAPAGAGTAAALGKNIEKAPAGAGTAAAVGKYREGSCWSRHCCGSEETVGGDSCGGVELLGKGMRCCGWIG